MKRLFLAILLAIASFSNEMYAQKEWGTFNSVALGVGIGTTGIEANVATPLSKHFTLQAGIAVMPGFKINTDVDVEASEYPGYSKSIKAQGNMQRTSGNLLVSYYPFNKVSFFVSAGAYFGGSSLISISAQDDDLKKLVAETGQAGIVIGNNTIPVDKEGRISGGIKDSSFRPYIGLGFGKIVPTKRLSPLVELGVQFHGKLKVYTDNGVLGNISEEGDDTFSDILDKVTVYPVLKFKLCGRIF